MVTLKHDDGKSFTEKTNDIENAAKRELGAVKEGAAKRYDNAVEAAKRGYREMSDKVNRDAQSATKAVYKNGDAVSQAEYDGKTLLAKEGRKAVDAAKGVYDKGAEAVAKGYDNAAREAADGWGRLKNSVEDMYEDAKKYMRNKK